jgi:hypothetical protein
MTPGASHTYTALYTFSGGAHRIWAQVDTDNTVGEAIENNNLYGCLLLNVTPLSTGAEAEAAGSTPMPTAAAPRHTPTPEAAILPAGPGSAEEASAPVPAP